MAAEGRQLFGPGSARPASTEPGAGGGGEGEGEAAATTGAGGWSIVLESFQGPTALGEANRRLAEASRDSGRRDVSVRATPRGAAIVAGWWVSPADPGAQAALQAIRSVEVRGERPYFQAFLAPPPQGADPGQLPELNLTGARSVFGARAVYTLQIAVYEAANRDEAKRAAEQAALRLRRDGELAFYYHGPARSMVTVGVFSDRDLEGPGRTPSPALSAVQQQYPLNLLNGQFPIIERPPGAKRGGPDDRKQPSTLVRIP